MVKQKFRNSVIFTLIFTLLIMNFNITEVHAASKTFDFDSGTMSGSTTPGDPPGANKNVTQNLSGHTLVITQDQGNILYMTASDYNGDSRTSLSGNAVILDMSYDSTNKLTLTIQGGYTFDLNSLNALDEAGAGLTLKFTSDKGAVTKPLTFDGNGQTIDLSAETALKGVSYVEITKNGGGTFLIELDNIVLDNITAPLIQLQKVTVNSFNSSGVVSWNNVSNESSYDVQLYKGGAPVGSAINKSADTLSHDFLSVMRSSGVGNYNVKVIAKGDGTTYSDSTPSDPSEYQAIAKLPTVSTGLTWTDDVAHWTGVANASNYDVQLYKDSNPVGSAINVLAANIASGADFASLISSNGGGTYTYKVTAKADATSLFLDADQSLASNNNIKSIQLSKVTNVQLSSAGVASWDNIDNEASYDIQLYKDGAIQGAIVNKSANTLAHDFLSAMRSAGAGDYTAKVTAKGNGSTYSDAPQSDASSPQTIIQLSAVSAGLTWTGNTAHWNSISSALSYDVQLYKDTTPVGSAINVLSANINAGADFSTLIASNGGGTYTYKVTAKGNASLILDAPISGASNNNVVASPLAQVTGASLSASGVATWNNVANEASYNVQLYKGATPIGSVVNIAADTLTYDFLSAMRTEGAGVYTVKVTAKGDGVTYSDGPQSVASTSQTVALISTVSAGLTWTGDVAHWNAVPNAVSYDVQLYKDGSPIGSHINVLSANVASGADFSSLIASNGSGNYTYKVTANADTTSLYLDSAQSVSSNENAKLAQVSNVALSDSGVASWDNVSNEASYDVQLYKDGVIQGAIVNKSANTLSHDFLSAMRNAGPGNYTVKVTAKGNDSTSFDGAQSVASSPQTIIQLSTVSAGLTWAGNTAHWTGVSNAVSYDVQLYKDGSPADSPINILSANASSGADFSSLIASNGGGTYTYKVTAKGNASLILDATVSVSSNNNTVATPLAQVTGASLSASGVASWNNVANETSYDVQLYKNGNPVGATVNVGADVLTYDFLSAMRTEGTGVYTIKVTANGDSTNYSDSPQSAASGSQTIAKLSTVSAGLTWTGDVAHWTGVSSAVSYDVQLYKDGSPVDSPINILSANVASGADFSSLIASNGGTYTYKVTAKSDSSTLSLDSEQSSASNENIKASQLTKVTGVSLSDSGVANWNNITNESSYDVQLYKNDAIEGSAISVPADTTSYDFLSDIKSAGIGNYTVKVTAKGNGTTFSDSVQSDVSNTKSLIQLSNVNSGLDWSGNVAKWNSVSDAVSYDVQLYKDNLAVGSPKNILSANISSGADFGADITSNGIGTYKYTVTAKGDTFLILDASESVYSSDLVVTVLDTDPPSAGGGGNISASNLTSNSVSLNWSTGTDNVTSDENLEYKLVKSTINNIDTVDDAEQNGIIIQDWMKNTTSGSALSLTPNTSYYFNVLIKDEAGNKNIYTPLLQTTEPGSPGIIQHIVSFESNGGGIIPAQIVNDGEKAIRPSDPTKSGHSFSGWYTESTIINEFDFNTQITTDTTLYAKWTANSSGGSSGGGSSQTPSTPSTPPSQNTNVIINGENFAVGKEEKRDLGNGKTETKVSVEKEAVLKQIEVKANTGGNNTVEIRGNTGENGALRIGLTGDIVKSMEDKSFDLSIKKDNVDYRIPAKEMTIDKVAQELGLSGSELQKIEVEVIISPISDELKKSIDEVSKTLNNTQFIVAPMNFEIKAKATSVDGKTMETNISTFNQYVERVMEIPNGVDPSKITTGIVFNEDGTFQHVPTVVYQENGKWYARINSRSNSSYSVVYNPIEVDAVKNHWAKESVNNMASRMVITEIEGFNPNEAITRGEFADYITRGLGIYKSNEQTNSKFSDVSGTKFEKSIIIAHKYGIISGYENNTFKPESKITREEAMSMFVRAMEITELAKNEQQSLVKFEDAKKVSPWALDSVKTAISSKIFNGRSAKKIEPKGIFTKAEAATAIQNLLIESKLINS